MSRGDNDSFFESLFDFTYEPSKFSSWAKLGCQVTVLASAIILLQALDGRGCGKGWGFWQPQTWGRPIGCFVRSAVLNIPEDFNEQKPGSNVVKPPETAAP